MLCYIMPRPQQRLSFNWLNNQGVKYWVTIEQLQSLVKKDSVQIVMIENKLFF